MEKFLTVLAFLVALSFAEESADSAVSSAASGSAKSAVQYMPLPPNATPLSDLAPKSGIAQKSQLMKPPRNEQYEHDIDFENREMEVTKKYVNPLSRDTMEMWSSTYPEIAAYVSTGDPLDKAGSYGIQGPFAIHVKEMHGDYNNVVGLPLARLYHEMKKVLSN